MPKEYIILLLVAYDFREYLFICPQYMDTSTDPL